jgi:hypothetical protein
MRSYVNSKSIALVFIASTTFIIGIHQFSFAQSPNIEGTYRLASRTLKDGTVIKPPEIVGLQTYTKQYRNFNINYKSPDGKVTSRSLVAEYTLTSEEYAEKPLFHMYVDDDKISRPALEAT